MNGSVKQKMVYDQLPISEKFTIELTRKQTALSTVLKIRQQVPEINTQMSIQISYPDLNQNIDQLVITAIDRLDEFLGDYKRACDVENSQTELGDFEKTATLPEIAARSKDYQEVIESEQAKAVEKGDPHKKAKAKKK